MKGQLNEQKGCFRPAKDSHEPKDQGHVASTLKQQRQVFGPPSRSPGVRDEDILSFDFKKKLNRYILDRKPHRCLRLRWQSQGHFSKKIILPQGIDTWGFFLVKGVVSYEEDLHSPARNFHTRSCQGDLSDIYFARSVDEAFSDCAR